MTDMGRWSKTLRGCFDSLTKLAVDRHLAAVGVLTDLNEGDAYRHLHGLTGVELAELFEALDEWDRQHAMPVTKQHMLRVMSGQGLTVACLGPYARPDTCLTAWASDHNPERAVFCESCRQQVMDLMEPLSLPWSPQWYELAGLDTRAGAPS